MVGEAISTHNRTLVKKDSCLFVLKERLPKEKQA